MRIVEGGKEAFADLASGLAYFRPAWSMMCSTTSTGSWCSSKSSSSAERFAPDAPGYPWR